MIMHEIVKINLDNEMDLIMAHKRAIKIAELCGLPTSAQTRFSTAVSEISRCSIAIGKNSVLTLGINDIKPNHKEIIAFLFIQMFSSPRNHDHNLAQWLLQIVACNERKLFQLFIFKCQLRI